MAAITNGICIGEFTNKIPTMEMVNSLLGCALVLLMITWLTKCSVIIRMYVSVCMYVSFGR